MVPPLWKKQMHGLRNYFGENFYYEAERVIEVLELDEEVYPPLITDSEELQHLGNVRYSYFVFSPIYFDY